jgi:hypothetical protein
MGLRGARFATMEDIKSNAMAELQKLPTMTGSMEQMYVHKGPTLKVRR